MTVLQLRDITGLDIDPAGTLWQRGIGPDRRVVEQDFPGKRDAAGFQGDAGGMPVVPPDIRRDYPDHFE